MQEISECCKAILCKLRGVNVFDFLPNHKSLGFNRRDCYLTECLLFLGITVGTESCQSNTKHRDEYSRSTSDHFLKISMKKSTQRFSSSVRTQSRIINGRSPGLFLVFRPSRPKRQWQSRVKTNERNLQLRGQRRHCTDFPIKLGSKRVFLTSTINWGQK